VYFRPVWIIASTTLNNARRSGGLINCSLTYRQIPVCTLNKNCVVGGGKVNGTGDSYWLEIGGDYSQDEGYEFFGENVAIEHLFHAAV
jgi:hypothetical protein